MTDTKSKRKNQLPLQSKRGERLVINVTPEIKKILQLEAAKEYETTSQYVFSILLSHVRGKQNG